jgi:aerobic carbon-monoxide dehydrogenase medium subunit
VVIAGSRGLREVAAENFFLGLFETDLRAGDVIVEFKIPRIRPQRRWVFMEFSRRRGDFAMAGLAAQLDISGAHIADARLVYFGCAEYPRLAKTVAGELIGHSLPLVDFDSIAAAIAEDLDPSDSAGMRADTKLKLATVVTKRALAELPDTTTSRPSAQ